MKLVGLMPVRNEDWILSLSLRAALLWVDSLVVFLHACTDHSPEIVEQVIREHDRGRVTVVWHGDQVWDEMTHRQEMLEWARRDGATHIAICDADEVITPGTWAMINTAEFGGMVQLPLYFMRGSLTRYHTNGIWGNRRIVDVAFKDHPALGWRGDRFHSRAPVGLALTPYHPVQHGEGGIMHLWGCSERRLKAKSALYKLTERLRWPEKPVAQIERMYNWAIYGEPGHPRYGTPDTWTFAETPANWWAPYKKWLPLVQVDAEPWQVAECARIIKANPGIEAGLDLFGIA